MSTNLMPMTFTLECPSCTQSLEAETAWANQQVDCPICGNPFTIPSPTLAPVARIAPPPIQAVSAVRLWNPNVAANWSVLFGPVFGSLLHYLNWRQLGESAKAKVALVWVFISVAWIFALAGIASLFPEAPLTWPLAVSFLVLWYFAGARHQISWVKEHHGNSYQKRSWLVPIGLSILILLSLSALPNLYDSLEQQPVEYLAPNKPHVPFTPASESSPYQQPQPVVAPPVQQTFAQVPSAQTIFQLTGEEALQAARKFMVGTWTYTGSNYTFLALEGGELTGGRGLRTKQTHGWIKWVVRDDGTMLKYRAPVVADDWGTPETAKWSITTGKFQNTGERYYRFMSETEDESYQDSLEKLSDSVVLINANGTLEYRVYSDLTILMKRGDKMPFSK